MARAPRSTQFQRAVEATPGIKNAHCPGIQALPAGDKARLTDKQLATGSIFLDARLRSAPAHASANRWDYGIGLAADDRGAETVLWLEVHHAASKQTDKVLKKLEWLKSWLATDAPALDRMHKRFVWLLSNVENNPNDRAHRNRLAEQHGMIRVQGRLCLGEQRRR